MRINQIVIVLFGLVFAALGLGFCLAPLEAAQALRMDAIGADGIAAVQADLAGLFIGLSALCLTGAFTKRRALLFAAMFLLAPIASRRLIDVILGVGPKGQVGILAVEAAAIAVLAVYARNLVPAAQPPGHHIRRRWVVAGAALGVLGTGIVLVLLNPRVELWMFQRVARQLTARDNSQLLADGALRVGICGSSAPLPSRERAKACVAVLAGGKFYLVDVGPESVENLMQWGIPMARIGGVLLTHFHSDHIGDLGELNLQTWAGGRPAPLAVYGGPGVEQVVDGFNRAYRLDQGYRTAHHTERVMPSVQWPLVAHTVELDGYPTPAKSRTATVLEDGALRITAIEVDHAPITPAYAYRFDYKGRSVVVSGDLKFHPPLAEAATGSDILVIEAIARPMTQAIQDGAAAVGRERQAAIMHDVQDYHISPAEGAKIANTAGVKLLVYYHLLPAPDSILARRLFGHDVRQVRRNGWVLADDDSLYTLPLDSADVKIGRVPQ